MKYLCLAYYDVVAYEQLTPEDLSQLGKDCGPHDQAFRETGQVGLIASLEHARSVTLRSRGGRISTIDGPFAETKEQVGSVFIIDAKDLNDAVRVASLHPAARMGEQLGWAIEVRPIEYFSEG